MPAPRANLSFVVPAYGVSPYLAECLASLAAQTVEVPRIVSTSTPHDELDAVCARHGARLVVHAPNRGIGHDWNMAYEAATTDWVTLAHQDDVYEPGYAAFVLDRAARFPDDAMVCSAYYEIVDGERRPTVAMLRIKRFLLEVGFLGAGRVTTAARKRLALRFGNPVACPTVALNKRVLDDFRFRDDMRTNMDWVAWLDIAERPGGISLSREALVGHRIHAGSETSASIDGGERHREDLEVFERLWPTPVARALAAVYARSYHSNEV